MNQGICYLVGAGPGDIGLVTLKAKACLEKADVLIYDALANPELLSWVPGHCEKINAGKRAAKHILKQEETNDLIVRKTQEGKTVVRLKGGDPMIFGRGGEEAAELAEAGVQYEIVPGISSAIAGPAYAGIPVTHRDHCSMLTLFTGHEDPTKGETSLDYDQLAKTPGTKVFLMGVKRMGEICSTLLDKGADPNTPIALTRWATTGRQSTVTGTLSTIADVVIKANFKSPAVAVIGEVVKEREKINWFEESRPLLGKRIVVTRTRQQAGQMSKLLGEIGADVLEIPTIQITEPDNMPQFLEFVADVHKYDWLIFTSPNGVHRFFKEFFQKYSDARSIGGVKIAAIGPGTRSAIAEYRLGTDLLPKKYVAEGLVEAFSHEQIENQTILWVKAKESRDVISEGLGKQGAIVDICLAYQSVPVTDDPTGNFTRFQEEGADVITFTSASTAENFFAMQPDIPEGCQIASIGPITSDALTQHGYAPQIESKESTIPAFVNTIKEALT